MADVPANAPQSCPGTESGLAGKASACQGCPNQRVCASGDARGADPDVAAIGHKLSDVKHVVLVLSGKGGVGKSTVTAMLASALSSDESKNVAVLDVDICGPSQPRIMGLEGEQVHQSGFGWSPVFLEENLSVMSVGFLLSGPDDAVIWRGPRKNGIIKQFLRDVDWGELDYLLVDTPPGTSDEHLSITQYLKECSLDGAILVTTPQEISLQDVRKEVSFCRKVGLPILGVIENMRGFVCPKCKVESEIFPATTGGAQKMCEELSIPFLGAVPLDPRIARSCDEGRSYLRDNPDAEASKVYGAVVQSITPKLTSTESSSNGKKLTNGAYQNGDKAELSGPKPVFYQVNGRRPHSSQRKQQEFVLPQHEELVQYLQNSWSAVCQEYEHAKQQQQTGSTSAKVVYKHVQGTVLPDFEPCNFERIWADHHYQSIMRST